MKTGYAITHRLTQDELNNGKANDLSGGLIEIIDDNGIPTGSVYLANGHGSLPTPISGGSPPPAEVEYTNHNPVPSAVGGIPAGATFDHRNMTQMFDQLLYPYQDPAFDSFSIQGQTSLLEVGDSVPANRTFLWHIANTANLIPNTVNIMDVTRSQPLAAGIANSGSLVSTSTICTKSSATSNLWRITAQNTRAQTLSRDISVQWMWRRYYGESSSPTLNESDIEALRVGGLSAGFTGTYNFSAGGYKYLCYPTALGTATVFKDASTNLDIPFDPVYTVLVSNLFGISTLYNVHRSANVMGSAIPIVVS